MSTLSVVGAFFFCSSWGVYHRLQQTPGLLAVGPCNGSLPVYSVHSKQVQLLVRWQGAERAEHCEV